MAPNQDLRKKDDANPEEPGAAGEGDEEEGEEEEEPDKGAREPKKTLPRRAAAKYDHPELAAVLSFIRQ